MILESYIDLSVEDIINQVLWAENTGMESSEGADE